MIYEHRTQLTTARWPTILLWILQIFQHLEKIKWRLCNTVSTLGIPIWQYCSGSFDDHCCRIFGTHIGEFDDNVKARMCILKIKLCPEIFDIFPTWKTCIGHTQSSTERMLPSVFSNYLTQNYKVHDYNF